MNSIRLYLVATLIAVFTLVTFVAALNGYLSSMNEAEKLLDSQISNAADLLAATDTVDPGLSNGTVQIAETIFAFQVWEGERLLRRSITAPGTAINAFEPGFHYLNFSGYRWRALIKAGHGERWYIVAERADQRHRLAEQLVLESILPLLLWLPVSALLIWLLVSFGLRPLRDLSARINQKRSDDLRSVVVDDPPSELVPLIDSTNALLARLSSAFEREKHFAAHAAHELRTPLSVLKVHLHNLAAELPPRHEGLAHANAGVERMHHLVEQILDLNRTNPDIIKANYASVDLHALVQRVTAASWPAFETKSQNLSLEGSATLMNGDPGMLEILIQNLLDNANKYTPKGGDVISTVAFVNGLPRLRVEDSGPGISEGDRDAVFQRFFRIGDGASSGENSSGLGLAIVAHIVELHGATIELGRSAQLGGLQVTVDFPAADKPLTIGGA